MTGCMVPGLRSGVDAGSLVLLSTGTVEGNKHIVVVDEAVVPKRYRRG